MNYTYNGQRTWSHKQFVPIANLESSFENMAIATPTCQKFRPNLWNFDAPKVSKDSGRVRVNLTDFDLGALCFADSRQNTFLAYSLWVHAPAMNVPGDPRGTNHSTTTHNQNYVKGSQMQSTTGWRRGGSVDEPTASPPATWRARCESHGLSGARASPPPAGTDCVWLLVAREHCSLHCTLIRPTN